MLLALLLACSEIWSHCLHLLHEASSQPVFSYTSLTQQQVTTAFSCKSVLLCHGTADMKKTSSQPSCSCFVGM